MVKTADASQLRRCRTGFASPVSKTSPVYSAVSPKRRGRHLLGTENEDVDDDEQDDGVAPVADKGRTKATKDDIDSDTNGKEHTCCDGVHPGKSSHGGCTTHYPYERVDNSI